MATSNILTSSIALINHVCDIVECPNNCNIDVVEKVKALREKLAKSNNEDLFIQLAFVKKIAITDEHIVIWFKDLKNPGINEILDILQEVFNTKKFVFFYDKCSFETCINTGVEIRRYFFGYDGEQNYNFAINHSFEDVLHDIFLEVIE